MRTASATSLDPLLKVDQVIQVLNLSRTSLYALINTGRLTGVKIGGARRFPESEVRRFIGSLTADK